MASRVWGQRLIIMVGKMLVVGQAMYNIASYFIYVMSCHIANICEIWGCTNDCNNPRYMLVIQVLQLLLHGYARIVQRDLV